MQDKDTTKLVLLKEHLNEIKKIFSKILDKLEKVLFLQHKIHSKLNLKCKNMNKNKKKYKVMVLFDDFKETNEEGLTYNEAKEKFLFYTQYVLTFNMNVRSENLMNNK